MSLVLFLHSISPSTCCDSNNFHIYNIFVLSASVWSVYNFETRHLSVLDCTDAIIYLYMQQVLAYMHVVQGSSKKKKNLEHLCSNLLGHLACYLIDVLYYAMQIVRGVVSLEMLSWKECLTRTYHDCIQSMEATFRRPDVRAC